MTKRKPRELASEAQRRNREQLAKLGGQVRAARLRRKWTQATLAAEAGVARSTVSDIERGLGGGHTLDAWQRFGLAVGTPLAVRLQRDALEETADAGHLAMQELLLRLGRRCGYLRSFELRTRPAEPRRSSDVGLRDDRRRVLVLEECWNSFGDIGGAARSTSRKVAEAEAFGIAIGEDQPYRVASVWVIRDTRRNRELVQRYPEVFASRCTGSSRRWVEALTPRADGSAPPEPPREPGLVWSDLGATRLFAWRRR